jgi:FKBP-type peptidyl-prolyl cis-trans isomerase SlyD
MKKIQLGSRVVLHALVTTAGDNEVISGEDDTLEFTCGKNQIFEAVETAVMGLGQGDVTYVQLEPEEHVGDYDAELVRVEERTGFPDNVEEGMMFEGLPNEPDAGIGHGQGQGDDAEQNHAKRIYLVTDVTDDVVVLDGNHPLAGIALKFKLTVTSIDAPESAVQDANRHASDFAPNFKAISRA